MKFHYIKIMQPTLYQVTILKPNLQGCHCQWSISGAASQQQVKGPTRVVKV